MPEEEIYTKPEEPLAKPKKLVDKKTVYASLIDVAGTILMIAFVFISPAIGVIIQLACYFITNRYFKEKFWKAFIFSVIILIIMGVSGIAILSSNLSLGLAFTEMVLPQTKVNCSQEVGFSRDACYSMSAYTQANSSLCEYVNDTMTRNVCYHDVAFRIDGTSICDKISGDTFGASLKAKCMAMETGNVSICDERMQGYDQSTYRDACYKDVAGKTQNLTLCMSVMHNETGCNEYLQKIKSGQYGVE
jgi:hypothetical protein